MANKSVGKIECAHYEAFALEWSTLTVSQSLILGKQGRGKGVITFLCAVLETTQETLPGELPCEEWQARTTAGAEVPGHRKHFVYHVNHHNRRKACFTTEKC